MTARERLWLIGTFLLSLGYWTWTVSWKFSLILMGSVLIHEYGHYWWMGKEGLTKKRMIFIPPLGALAIAKEPWPSLLAEARIALAGPIIGLLPGIFFLIAWLIFPGQIIWPASAFLVAFINLLNLLIPSIVTDGGRVVKSIAFSLSPKLGVGLFVISCPVLLSIVILTKNPFLTIFAILLIWQSWLEIKQWRMASGLLLAHRQRGDFDTLSAEEQHLLRAVTFANKMNGKEAVSVSLVFAWIISIYFFLLWLITAHGHVNPHNFYSAFN